MGWEEEVDYVKRAEVVDKNQKEYDHFCEGGVGAKWVERRKNGKIKMPSNRWSTLIRSHAHSVRIEQNDVNIFEFIHMLTIINVTKDIQKGKSNK